MDKAFDPFFFCLMLFFRGEDHPDGVWATLVHLSFREHRPKVVVGSRGNENCVAPRTSWRVGGHESGPSVALQPFWEPSSTAGVASELASTGAREKTGGP